MRSRETMLELGRARQPRGRLPAHRHGPAARRRRRQRARDRRGERHRPRRRAARLHRARARRLRPATRRSPTSGSTWRRGDGGPRRPSADGSALALYERWIRAQGGDPDPDALPQAPVVLPVEAPRAGSVTRLGAIAVGIAALHLGAGRRAKEDEIDHAVGVVCRVKRGESVDGGRRARRGARARRGERGGGGGGRPAPRTSSATSRPASTTILLDVVA